MKIIKEWGPYVVIILAVILFRSFIATPVRVSGSSMDNTLANGQILILNKLAKNYKRMDIVVFEYKKERLIKRVIGLPGETVRIEDNKLYINNELVDDYSPYVKTANYNLSSIIPEGYYFVLGDNRYNSSDSRIIGLIKKEDILGKTNIRIFPFTKIGRI